MPEKRLSNKALGAILGAVLLLAAIPAGVYLLAPRGGSVRVTVAGREYGTYPLNRDATITITPEDGAWYNTLVIQDGTARITASDCPNQICVHTPALTPATIGIITCLPHKLTVELF